MGNKQKPNNTNEIIEKNAFTCLEWQETLTVLDLSNKDISNFDENVKLPQNLVELNLANNMLTVVPETVLKLDKLKTLNLSYNKIELFDETPNFCHSLESLKLINNKLNGPPYWIWAEHPKNLVHLNLSCNKDICQSFDNFYFEELLQYTTLVKEIDLHNCRLGKHMKLLSTFRHAKVVNLGNNNYNFISVNHIESVPCVGLEDCHEIEVLNLCNTNIYNIQHNIGLYKYLIEINLSQNNIHSLPNEFCNLEKLETCILSFNKILYLPDDMHKLRRLTKLYLDNNELCMVSDALSQLKSLKTLDLYNNHLYEGILDMKMLEQYDFAQNYDDEPNDEEYLKKKTWLRQNCSARFDGGRVPPVHEESEDSEREFDYSVNDVSDVTEGELQLVQEEPTDSRSSSPEDWDSDNYWIPCLVDFSQNIRKQIQRPSTMSPLPTHSQWLEYVRSKMAEGNFCPMDMHLAVSITDKVKYEKMHNPRPQYESDGQFDDYSDDDT